MKLTKINAGNYTVTFHGIRFDVSRNTERDTSWFGEWAITYGFHGGSDPIKTLRGCREALQHMHDHPDQYWPERFKTYTCANCVSPFVEDSRLVMDEGRDLWCPACTDSLMAE